MSAAPTIHGSSVTPESPWLGLRSFTEEAQSFFFGRTEELDDLYERTLDKPLAVLFGQSGLGKSSLLQAALVPRLRTTGFLPVFIRFDHETNAPALEYQLLDRLRVALESAGYEQQAATLSTALTDGKAPLDYSAFLWLLFHDPAYSFIPPRGAPSDGFPRPVFLMDQFEEIFTLGERPARRSTSTAFRETLAALVENRPPPSLRAMLEEDDNLAERLDYKARYARVLLSLREDFLHLLERWRRSMPSLMENRLELRMLSSPQAFLAVVRPGQLRSGMPAIIPDQVGQAIVRFVAGADEDVPLDEIDAVPPLLSLVCAELNAQRLDSGGPQITQAQFEGHGTDILKSFYLRSFDLATYGSVLEGVTDAGAALKNLRRLIEDRLLSPDGFRESIAFDTIARDLSHAAGPDGSKAVLNALVERRLLTVEERGGVRRLELAHDVLTRIVKGSRDERHEVEAVSRARSEQARAEAETTRVLKERNRLKRLAILASCLAVIAAASAIVGWLSFRQSEEAKRQAFHARNQAVEAERTAVDARNQAIVAKNEAQVGFESAWKGLTTLYDDYASGTLENTPGISRRQANALKSRLRGHLLEQLRKLNHEQPDHRGTIQYIARLLLDEGREAVDDGDYTRAQHRLVDALQWSEKRPLDTGPDAETYAEILHQQAIAEYCLSGNKKGNEIAENHLRKVRDLVPKWPDSWRLAFVVIRLESFIIWDNPRNRRALSALAERFVPLIEKSAGHFDVVISHFGFRQKAYWGEGNFDRSAADYALETKLIVWFGEHLFRGDAYTLVQLELAAGQFQDVLSFVQTQFSQPNDKKTADERRAILNELETTMKAIETRLPKSTVVYGIRGDLLALQEMSVKQGINTRSPDELRAAAQKHRMVAAALGVGSSVADLLAPAFKSYTADNADEASKTSAVATAQNSVRDFMSLDFVGADTVLQNSDITGSVEKLQKTKPADPLLTLHGQMVEQYIRLYQQASPDAKSAFVGSFSSASAAAVESWFTSGQHDQVTAFWQRCYEGLPISTLTSGDKESFVRQLNRCVRSLLKTGKYVEGKKLLNDTVALCDAILAERPWDWYVNSRYEILCFEVAAELAEIGDKASAQPLLRRGWSRLLKMYGKAIDLDRYPELPLKGEVPEKAPEDDAEFFARFGKDGRPKAGVALMKRFTIQCDFNGIKYPFNVYAVSGRNGYAELQDQFRWVKEIRGGIVPAEAQDSFKHQNDIAVENKLDFMELCVGALGTVATPQQRLDAAIEELKYSEAQYLKQKSDSNGLNLARAYNSASDRALYRARWTDAENWALKSMVFNTSSDASAYGNLATAYLFQGKYEKALEIYRAHWLDPTNGKTLGESALANLEALENAGIKHPDVARIKAAIGTNTANPPASEGKPKAETKP